MCVERAVLAYGKLTNNADHNIKRTSEKKRSVAQLLYCWKKMVCGNDESDRLRKPMHAWYQIPTTTATVEQTY